MAVWRMQCSFQFDSPLPAESIIMTPHFDTRIGSGDVPSLVNDLSTALAAWTPQVQQVTVKAYDAQGTPPVYPQGMAVRDTGLWPAASGPRELACCLSFFAGHNRPRYRGRLYVPYAIIVGTLGTRPSATQQQKCADLVPIFAGLGGADIDWVVYSRRDNAARKVTNWWVDNAWDVQRSRGLPTTARLEGTTSG